MAATPSWRMGLLPRSYATDAHHCSMVEGLPDLPNTSV